MTQSKDFCFHLPAEVVFTLAKRPFGKLTPVLTLDETATPFTLFDDFDQSLRRTSRLLLKAGTSFELLMSDGRVLCQSAERQGGFVADFHQGPVKLALADLSPLRSLLPVGSGKMRRGQIAVLDDDHKTHCRAHLRILTETGAKSAAIVTLQGLRGYDTSLAELRKHIEACGGSALGQGGLYTALFPEQNAYNAKPQIVVGPDDTAFAAATDIISSYISVARANEAGIIADQDTECLHDYRVALRKIRSVLSLFKGVYAEKQSVDLKTRFSDVMTSTGRLRDLDVYLLEKQRYCDLLPKTLHGGLDRMFILFTEERKIENARLASYLQSKDYVKEISNLARLFDKRKKLYPGPTADLGAYDFACAQIWNRYRKIRDFAARISPETGDAEVHRLRIHCKKLRYLMEFFGPLFPKPEFKALLKPLKLLQDNLGFFNDYAVQQVSLQDFLWQRGHWPEGVNLEVSQSVGALTAVLHHRQNEERVKVAQNFAHFNSSSIQTTYRDLFHAKKTKP